MTANKTKQIHQVQAQVNVDVEKKHVQHPRRYAEHILTLIEKGATHIAVAGPPGIGKSTVIRQVMSELIQQNKYVAADKHRPHLYFNLDEPTPLAPLFHKTVSPSDGVLYKFSNLPAALLKQRKLLTSSVWAFDGLSRCPADVRLRDAVGGFWGHPHDRAVCWDELSAFGGSRYDEVAGLYIIECPDADNLPERLAPFFSYLREDKGFIVQMLPAPVREITFFRNMVASHGYTVAATSTWLPDAVKFTGGHPEHLLSIVREMEKRLVWISNPLSATDYSRLLHEVCVVMTEITARAQRAIKIVCENKQAENAADYFRFDGSFEAGSYYGRDYPSLDLGEIEELLEQSTPGSWVGRVNEIVKLDENKELIGKTPFLLRQVIAHLLRETTPERDALVLGLRKELHATNIRLNELRKAIAGRE